MTRCRYCTQPPVANGRCEKHQEPLVKRGSDQARTDLLRRLRLVALLRKSRTMRELAKIFGVSLRTMQRDLILLREIGLPVTERVGPRGRKSWRILKWVEVMKNLGTAPKE